MKRRSFLGAVTASITAVFLPKESIAEDNKKFPYKGYLVGVPEPVAKTINLDSSRTEISSECVIEDGYIALYSTGFARIGDVIQTDVFQDSLYVKEVMDESLTDIGFITKHKLTLLRDNKVCGKSVIKMANGKLRLLRKGHWPMKCRYTVIYSCFREGSN